MLPPNPPHDPFYSASKSSSSTAHPLHQRSEIFEEERSSASGSGEGSLCEHVFNSLHNVEQLGTIVLRVQKQVLLTLISLVRLV